MRDIMANHWTAAVLGTMAVGLHALWYLCSPHQGDVITGFGGFLAVLGIFVAAQPYIRKGLVETAREQVGLHDAERRKHDVHHRADEVEAESVSRSVFLV